MKNKYDYRVWREGNSVIFIVERNRQEVTRRVMGWTDLNFFIAVFWARPESERCINQEFKKAHKLAKFAIKTMEKQERRNGDDTEL